MFLVEDVWPAIMKASQIHPSSSVHPGAPDRELVSGFATLRYRTQAQALAPVLVLVVVLVRALVRVLVLAHPLAPALVPAPVPVPVLVLAPALAPAPVQLQTPGLPRKLLVHEKNLLHVRRMQEQQARVPKHHLSLIHI